VAQSTSEVQADFDRIALLPEDNWNHNSHYHKFLLEHVPPGCRESLDIGCGTGTFSRLLAGRSEQVLALDLSPHMIRIAQERSKGFSNIDFRVENASTWEFPLERFDCIASIATLHHLPITETLQKIKGALRVGGTVVILDLYDPAGISDLLSNIVAAPVSRMLGWLKNGRFRKPHRVREAWAEHGRHDSYPTLADVQYVCARILPGAKIKKHLFWRYSLVWTKEA
jgi:SAM-dependent methyltransferase